LIQYFAYGSNMDEDDFNKWCENHGKEKRFEDIFRNIQPVKLNDYALRFNYYSINRCGGAANIMPAQGKCVYGLLMDIKDQDLAIVDEKEGLRTYQKLTVAVKTISDSTPIPDVTTYKVVNTNETEKDCPPTIEYLHLIIKSAINNEFPIEYIRELNQIQTKK
jgi:hypothetical protein